MGLDSYLSAVEENGALTEVAYWRKANAIHRWFVENVQNGVDECQESPVSREQLNELLEVCYEVLQSTHLIDGFVRNGSHMGPDTNGKWVDDYIDGKVIENPEVAEQLLPTEDGFFFGSIAYDQYYYQNIKDTVRMLQAALDSNVQEFVYQASW